MKRLIFPLLLLLLVIACSQGIPDQTLTGTASAQLKDLRFSGEIGMTGTISFQTHSAINTPIVTPIPSDTSTLTETSTQVSPTDTLTPSITPTPSQTFTPTITPTPVPDNRILGEMTIQIGNKRCAKFSDRGNELGRLLFTDAKKPYDNRGNYAYDYYSLEYTYTTLSPHIQLETSGDTNCVSVAEDALPGHYYVHYFIKVYDEIGPNINPATREFLTEGFAYFRIRALPPADTTTRGDLIAFVDNGEIYLMNPDGSGLNHVNAGSRPKWSPDGRKILFTEPAFGPSLGSMSNGIYLASLDDEGIIQASDHGFNPIWSPDGSLIAYSDLDSDIWVMDADGSNKRNLISIRGGAQDDFSWSPDSKRIVFSTYDEIYIFNLESLEYFTLAEKNVILLDWSPTGEIIAFSNRSDGLYLINSDGSNLRNITPGIRRLDCFSWSNDGRRIAISGGWPQEWLYVVNADGTGLKQLVEGAAWTCPEWSSDDDKIVFVMEIPLRFWPSHSYEVHIVDSDGSNLTRLTYGYFTGDDQQYDELDWQP